MNGIESFLITLACVSLTGALACLVWYRHRQHQEQLHQERVAQVRYAASTLQSIRERERQNITAASQRQDLLLSDRKSGDLRKAVSRLMPSTKLAQAGQSASGPIDEWNW